MNIFTNTPMWVNISRWDQEALNGNWSEDKLNKNRSKLRVSAVLQLDLGTNVYEYTVSSIVVSLSSFVIKLKL